VAAFFGPRCDFVGDRDLRPAILGGRDPQQRAVTQRILRAFGWIILVQTFLIGSAIFWCVGAGAKDMIFPSIGLIVSVHFAPLARLFHVRACYTTALAGAIISLSAFTGLTDIPRFAWFGGAMAAGMWLSAWHILRNADQIAAEAVQEQWVG